MCGCNYCCSSCSSMLNLHNGGTIHVQDKSFTIVTILNECPSYTVYLVRLNQGTLYQTIGVTDINDFSNLYTLKRVRYDQFNFSQYEEEEEEETHLDQDSDKELSDYAINEIKGCQLFTDEKYIVDVLTYQVHYERIPTLSVPSSSSTSPWIWQKTFGSLFASKAKAPLLTSMSFTDIVFPYSCTLQDLINKNILAPSTFFFTNENILKILRDIAAGLSILQEKGYSYNNLNTNTVTMAHDSTTMHADLAKSVRLSDLSLIVKQPFEWNSKYFEYMNELNLSYSSPEVVSLKSKKKDRFSKNGFSSPDGSTYSLSTENPPIDGFANDIWSFGCLVYCILYGLNPFERQEQLVGGSPLEDFIKRGDYSFPGDPPTYSNTGEILEQQNEEGTTGDGSLPKAQHFWNSLIKNCLKVDPHERFTLKDLTQSLDEIERNALQVAVPPAY
ncbi:hypothetical protein ACO0QE_003610 [Hanseniaspora vineae]